MIVGDAFAAWLADRDAQKRSHQGVEACAQRWGWHPLMTELKGELMAMSPPTPDAVLGVARRFMDRTEDIQALVADLIASSRADPFFSPPFHPVSSEIHDGLMLFNSEELLLAIGIAGVDMLAAKKAGKRGATSIGFSGQLTAFRYLKSGNATISFWEAPRIGDDFTAGQAGSPRLVDRRRIHDGEEIVIDGRYQSFIIEHATSDMVYFQALVRTGSAPVAVEYDSKTLSFVSAAGADETSSRIQMMVSLLRIMDRDDALPIIEKMLATPYFHARWHIMREMLALDAEASLPALRRMAEGDPHPEIRATARQTLDLFFAQEPAGEEAMSCRA
jgi:hypothetical protein